MNLYPLSLPYHFNSISLTMEQLSLDLSLAASVPKTLSSLFPGDLSHNRDSSQKLAMLDNFVHRLEEEMKKVEAFQRELPLCMLLVKDAIEKLEEEKIRCMGMQKQDPTPVTEQFLPLKANSGENGNGLTVEKESSCDKKNWMSSAQLWTKLRNGEDDRSVPDNPIQFREQKNSIGGALIAFNGNSRVTEAVSKEVSKVPSFSLMANRQSQPQPPPHMQQNQRKQRRCWSPELHRRFVDALQQLGGAQVATPKQIRELMQVEGLTNDEVKSHLQKYRLHARSGDTNKSKGNSSQSGSSPQGPLTPLLLGWSAPGQNSVDAEEEEHSDGRNWKDGVHHQPEPDHHSHSL